MKRNHALKLRAIIEKAAISLDDTDALSAVELFPVWMTDTAYALDFRVRDAGVLYKCIQPHTSQTGWEPHNTPALWAGVEEPGQGDTPENPIPYNGNMELHLGKYYEQYGIVYICIRDSQIPVYADLSALVGNYVEVYEG